MYKKNLSVKVAHLISEWFISMSESEDEGSERQLKVILLGEPQSGKTSICQRYLQHKHHDLSGLLLKGGLSIFRHKNIAHIKGFT